MDGTIGTPQETVRKARRETRVDGDMQGLDSACSQHTVQQQLLPSFPRGDQLVGLWVVPKEVHL